MPEQTVYNRPNRPFRLEPYNSMWAKQFHTLEVELRKLLGEEVIRIEHVGSTSVPGMLGKSQIDILIEVRNLSHISAYYKSMEAAGYIPKGDYALVGEEYFAKDLPNGSRFSSVHILPTGHWHIQNLLGLREYLRTHPGEVDSYNRVKQAAFDNAGEDYNAYFKAKELYVESLVKRVESWRKSTKHEF